MLKLILIAGIGLMASCGAMKERKLEKEAEKAQSEAVVEETPNVISAERPMREEDIIEVEGVVRINNNGCPVLIEMIEGDLFSLAYPVNLDNKYKVDGKKISFQYTISRAQSVQGCGADKVIAVSNVKVL